MVPVFSSHPVWYPYTILEDEPGKKVAFGRGPGLLDCWQCKVGRLVMELRLVCRGSGVVAWWCQRLEGWFAALGSRERRTLQDGQVVNPVWWFKSLIQVFWCSAAWTMCFFFVDLEKRSKAMSLGQLPCNNPGCLKRVLFPSPSVMRVHLAKRTLSGSSHVTSIPTQALSGEVHSCHSHWSRRARANLPKWSTPSPLSCFGSVGVGLVDLAFASRQSLVARQKKTSTNFVEVLQHLFWWIDDC
jgi:hypothetical protein